MQPMALRRFLHFLLISLLVNAGGWTFNRDAVADVFFVGEETILAGTAQSAQAGQPHADPLKAKAPCNHWCHAEGHFLGLFGQASTFSSKRIAGYSSQISRFIPEPSPEDLFRPPRLLS